MKKTKNYNLLFFVLACLYCLSFLSCKTISPSMNNRSNETKNISGKIQKDNFIPIKDHLTGRIWRLAGINISGNFFGLDANMEAGKINFLTSGKFESTTGIASYEGMWKKWRIKNNRFSFLLQVNSRKVLDPENTIGKEFDNAFMNNLKNTIYAEISQNDLKFYSKDEDVILHFIRM